MREPRFLHVGITYSPTVDLNVVDQVIESESIDWLRYTWWTYIIWTSSDCETVCRKILRIPGLESAGNVFVCALDVNDGFGSLSPSAWEWLKRDRGYGALETWAPPDIRQPDWPRLPES